MSDLRFHLLPGRCPNHFQAQELHDRVYLFWKSFWDKVLIELDGSSASPAEFDRQDVVGVITSGPDIVSVHLYSKFSSQSIAARAHPYFSSYEEQFHAWLQKIGNTSVMSMEYLTLNPAYRKRQMGFSLAHVIVGLGTRVQKDIRAEWSVAPCRKDLHVDEIAAHFGARGLEARIMHNVPVVSMLLKDTEIRRCSMLREAGLIEKMWAERLDHTRSLDHKKTVHATKGAA